MLLACAWCFLESLGCLNVQCAHVQFGVDAANEVSFFVMERLGDNMLKYDLFCWQLLSTPKVSFSFLLDWFGDVQKPVFP